MLRLGRIEAGAGWLNQKRRYRRLFLCAIKSVAAYAYFDWGSSQFDAK
jgi:hypothetical protein